MLKVNFRCWLTEPSLELHEKRIAMNTKSKREYLRIGKMIWIENILCYQRPLNKAGDHSPAFTESSQN